MPENWVNCILSTATRCFLSENTLACLKRARDQISIVRFFFHTNRFGKLIKSYCESQNIIWQQKLDNTQTNAWENLMKKKHITWLFALRHIIIKTLWN